MCDTIINERVKKTLEQITEKHTSTIYKADGSEDKIKQSLNIFELNTLLKSGECPSMRSCSDCKITFPTTELYHKHLKEVCEHVKIQCSECNQFMGRAYFKKHQCYQQ